MTGLQLFGYGMDYARHGAAQFHSQAVDQVNARAPAPGGFFDDVEAAQATSAGAGISTLGQIGMFTGAALGAVGSYFQAEAQKEQLRAQSSYAEHQARLAALNARQAELDAQSILRSGRQQIGLQTLQAGQEKARRKTSAAARGVQLGVGSTAELLASEDIAKEIDKGVIRTNAVRAANASRTQATNARNQAVFGRLQAGNLRRTSNTIRPVMSGVTSALGSAGRIANFYASR